MSRMNVLSMLFVQLNVQKLKEALRIIVPHHFRSPLTTLYFYDLLTFLGIIFGGSPLAQKCCEAR